MKNILLSVFIFLSLNSCVKDEFEIPEIICSDSEIVTKTIQDIHTIATDTPFLYSDNDIIEAYVVSSDQSGNFFKTISMQALNGSLGITVPVDVNDLYTIYNPGRKVYLKLKSLYIQKDHDMLMIGNLVDDNISRITSTQYQDVLIKSCEVINENELVNQIKIEEINDSHLNTLVELTGVQFNNNALGSSYFESGNSVGGSTNLFIIDETGASQIIRTSRFADFSSNTIPEGNGTIRGILTKFADDYQLFIRTLLDVNLNNDRLDIIVNLKNNLFITEIADPNNNADARFIEIYNAENEAVSLNGWKLRRYTNTSTSISSEIDLTGNTIEAGQAFTVSVNATTFESVFGFAPDFNAGSGSPANSNGDDNFELVDSQGNIVDVFGVVGIDGTGTNHEFEDGRALRNTSVTKGNITYTFSEWQIWNDSGDAGTINEPQDAPGNFTPGVR